MVSEKEVLEALKTVLDPEIAFNIVDLGLVYGIAIEGKTVSIKMTMTTPLCPMAPEIIGEVKTTVGKLEGIEKVEVEIVWNPPWTPDKMSEQAKIELGLV